MFADLAGYLLRKNAYKAGKAVKNTYKLFANENFDFLTDDSFKFILLSSFHKKDEVIGKDLFELTEAISRDFLFGNFEYILRIGENGEPRWDKEYLEKQIDLASVSKIFITGPCQAVYNIKEILKEIGIPKETIYEL